MKGAKVDGGGGWESDAHGLSWARSARHRCKEHNRFATKTYVDIASSESSSSELTPSFSVYRFVASRSRGGSHTSTLREPPRLSNAPPAPAVKEPLRGPLKTGRRLPGYPIISNEFPQAGPALGTPRLSVPAGVGRRVRRHGTLGRDPTRMAKKMEPLLFRADCAAVAAGYHRYCLLQYQAVPPFEKPRAPPLRTRPGCS